jgi:hypothetical protein
MSVSAKDRAIIRELARKVAEIAHLPVQQEKRELWIRLNRLERVRPLIHVQAIVEVNLQDLHTVRHEPHRLIEWNRLARRLAEEYA